MPLDKSTANGAKIIHYDDNGDDAVQWRLESTEHQDAQFGTTAEVGKTYNGTISNAENYKWYKILMNKNTSKRLLLHLKNNSKNKANIKLEVYTGSADNPVTFVDVVKCNYESAKLSVFLGDISTSRYFYIRVCSEKDNFIPFSYSLSLSLTDEPYAGEAYGWNYRGDKCKATVEFNLRDSSLNQRVTYDGISYTYRRLIEEAISVWNSKNVKGDGTVLFKVNNGLQLRTIKAKVIENATALTYANGSIDLNTNDFPSLDKQTAIDVIMHEMGHTLGLADLYIGPQDNYVYKGTTIDNRNKLMFGWWNVQLLDGTGAERIHSNDAFGIKRIQGWASYKKLTEEELYQQADIIVKGTIQSVNDYIDNPEEDAKELYSKVTLKADKYLRGEYVKELQFLQLGQSSCPMAVDPIFQPGEECLLYLYYGHDGNLYVLGGPQGRFNIDNQSNRIINQIDRYNYESMKDVHGVIRPEWKNISKEQKQFLHQAVNKQKAIRKIGR